MAYPTPLAYITAGGTHAGGREVWQVGIHTDPFVTTPAIMASLATIWSAWMSAGLSRHSAAAQLEWVKVAQLAASGKYLSLSEPTVAEVVPPVPGSAPGNYTPQATIVVSWTTGLKRGLAHGGRIFPPPTSLQATSDGKCNNSDILGIANQAATLIQAINSALGGTAECVVASRVGAGGIRTINGVRVGNVIDTQRRRRNQLVEDYQIAPIIGTP